MSAWFQNDENRVSRNSFGVALNCGIGSSSSKCGREELRRDDLPAGAPRFGSVRSTEHGAISFLFGKRNKDPIVVRGPQNTRKKGQSQLGKRKRSVSEHCGLGR